MYNQQNNYQQPNGPVQARNDTPAWARAGGFNQPQMQNNGWQQPSGLGRI